MAIEIERKFLVINNDFKALSSECLTIKQGYLCRDIDRTVRVRTIDCKGFLTVKGRNKGISRLEFEYEIPYPDAEELLKLCAKFLEKKRYIVYHDGLRWEIDEFSGELAPLVIAEVELPDPEYVYSLPSFIGEEVSNDPCYFNSNLIR